VDLTTGPIDKEKHYVRVGPLAYDEQLLIVMNQGVVIGSVLLQSIKAISRLVTVAADTWFRGSLSWRNFPAGRPAPAADSLARGGHGRRGEVLSP